MLVIVLQKIHIIIQLFAPLSARNQPSDSSATLQSPFLDRFHLRDTSLWKQSVLRIEFKNRMLKNLFAKMRASPRTSNGSQQNLQGSLTCRLYQFQFAFNKLYFGSPSVLFVANDIFDRRLWTGIVNSSTMIDDQCHPNLGDGDGRKDREDSWRGQVLGFGLMIPNLM
jgi:hypothetical protein